MPESRPIAVWDLPTRLFHWTLVVLIALQYASGEFGWLSMEWHFLLGYATLALVLFRVLWGFLGSQTSRFSDFVRGPGALFGYAADFVRGHLVHSPGHNPLGGWSVLAMLACVALQAATGLFTSDDVLDEGPLTGKVSSTTVALMSRIHAINRYVLVALIALHVGAVALHFVLRNHNLLAPMVTGRARHPEPRELRFVPVWRAVALLALAAAVVWGLVAWGEAA
ncbi:MAG: cytochrome b/b6 domain-containing protein [Xanthomonadales bacterium]|nr:cytochrome b/b6 domain-containing protein [Xanthomonadales bacterium]